MTKVINLTDLKLTRPEKISWRFPVNPSDILSVMKSKTTRHFLKSSDQHLSEFGITWEHKKINKDQYIEWLKYYAGKMQEQEYEVVANAEWFDKRSSEGRSIEGIFFYRNSELIGSEIFSITSDNKAIAAFKASERLEDFSKKRNSLGAVIDYTFITLMVKKNITHISFGRSRNEYFGKFRL